MWVLLVPRLLSHTNEILKVVYTHTINWPYTQAPFGPGPTLALSNSHSLPFHVRVWFCETIVLRFISSLLLPTE